MLPLAFGLLVIFMLGLLTGFSCELGLSLDLDLDFRGGLGGTANLLISPPLLYILLLLDDKLFYILV